MWLFQDHGEDYDSNGKAKYYYGVIVYFLTFWNEYIIAYTLMDEHGTLAMGLQNLMAVERTATNYGIMYAGLVIVMLPVLIFYICVQKRLTEGMTLGGLKG